MANRHKAFKKGGNVMVDNGPASVIKEAKERKDGGDVKVSGKMAGGRLDRASGGKCAVEYGKSQVVSAAKSGGGKSPFSSAGGGGASKNPYITSAKGPR